MCVKNIPCSFDLRSAPSDGQHWKDHNTLGNIVKNFKPLMQTSDSIFS